MIGVRSSVPWILASLLVSGCSSEPGFQGPYADPQTVMPMSVLQPVRGLSPRRGLIHHHSPYSHDACDGEPFPNGVRNEVCFEEVRAGVCQTGQDFLMLSDHNNLFADYEFPEVLLYKEGDTLIEHGGAPTANRIPCADGSSVMILAGTETCMMPVGLEHHVGATEAERDAAYEAEGPEAIAALKAAGAVVLLQHTEGWSVDSMIENPIDGIEIFNIHYTMMVNGGVVLDFLTRMDTEREKLPDAELLAVPLLLENTLYLEKWASALMHKRLVGVLATDAHRNTFPADAGDGERIDSFRRLDHWFSNYLLVPEGEVDDRALKDALRTGHAYGVFHYLGYAVDFDFHATAGEQVYEMGDQIPAGQTAELFLKVPGIYHLDPKGAQPVILARILKAGEGTWEEVASGATDLVYTAGPGVYRGEVRVTPWHLLPWLGTEGKEYVHEMPWVYSNPIYVGTGY